MLKISMILAVNSLGYIGKDNGLMWKIPEDMKLFREKTMGRPVIMGANTFASMGSKPLPKRVNIVVTSKAHLLSTNIQLSLLMEGKSNGAIHMPSLDKALRCVENLNKVQQDDPTFYPEINFLEPFLIGGKRIYEEGFEIADDIHLTKVKNDEVGDVKVDFELSNGDWEVIHTVDLVPNLICPMSPEVQYLHWRRRSEPSILEEPHEAAI